VSLLADDKGLSNIDKQTIQDIKKRVDEMKKTIKLPDVQKNSSSKQKAAEDAKIWSTPEKQQLIEQKKTAIKKDMERYDKSLKGLSTYNPGCKISEDKAKAKGILSRTEKIYVFVSSSVPTQVFRDYIEDCDKMNDSQVIVAMQGFIGGMKYIIPTIRFIERTISKDKNCDLSKEDCEVFNTGVQIDPEAFMKYKISTVPAIVYVRGLSLTGDEDELGEGGDSWVVYGDVSLEYALTTINRQARSANIDALIKRLRKGYYSERRR
jgi:type-F conjugative transfer system pilin assembly protein TrbC